MGPQEKEKGGICFPVRLSITGAPDGTTSRLSSSITQFLRPTLPDTPEGKQWTQNKTPSSGMLSLLVLYVIHTCDLARHYTSPSRAQVGFCFG